MTQKTDLLNKTTENVVLKKRGRKPKKDVEQNSNNIVMAIEEKPDKEVSVVSCDIVDSNLNTDINADINTDINADINADINTDINNSNILEEEEEINENTLLTSVQKPFAKKRGRKPKGGKIIQQIVSLNNNKETKPNVILHLKCFFKDLHTNTFLNQNIECFNPNNNLTYEIINSNNNNNNKAKTCEFVNNEDNNNNCDDCCDYKNNKQNKENDIKELWKKLKQLEHNLHINNISDKKSACFWCTYEFDNPSVYIPKFFIKETYNVYGCFCSPECATAYLMEENIDSSSKFERYYLINHIYAKIYNYNKNIKPAPNPYYLLEKYYGNLTIQEYRSLFKNERLFLVVDKPLTRILPELHEDNDDFIINNKIIPSNTSSSTYQIKKKMQKAQTKTNMLTEKFGFNN
jgi:hypothetical protein